MTSTTLDYIGGSRHRVREDGDLRVLRAIHSHGLMHSTCWLDRRFTGLSQADAATATGLSRASVSTLAKGLRGRNLLVPGTDGMVLDPSQGIACGIDIGFEQIRVAGADLHGQLLAEPDEYQVALGAEPERCIEWVAERLTALVEHAASVGANASNVVGVGISMAGAVDRHTGKLRQGWSTGGHWRVLSAKTQLEQRLGWNTPFFVDRDANASALADALWDMGAGVESSLFVKWSAAGVSASLIFDHQIFRGAHGTAGEIGHAVVRTKPSDQGCLKDWLQNHPVCEDCGQACLEKVTSLRALREYVQNDRLSVEDLLSLARTPTQESDETSSAYRARHGLETAARCLGRVLAPVITTLNPRLVTIGGKIGAHGYPIIGLALSEGIREGEVTPAIESVEILGGSPNLTGKASVRGAIALALLEEDRSADRPWWLATLDDKHKHALLATAQAVQA